VSIPPIGNKIIPAVTPVHVTQLVLQLLRLTFKSIYTPETGVMDTYPFRYRDDPDASGIFIVPAMNNKLDMPGQKPVIIVARGMISSQPPIIGDMMRGNLGDLTATKATMVNSSIDITIVSRGESQTDILSNEVFQFLVACRTMLPNLTAIQQVHSVTATPVTNFMEDDHRFMAQVSAQYIMQYKWDWQIIPILLNEIGLFINDELRMDLPGEES